MSYKRFFLGILSGFFAIQMIWIFFAYFVDPIGIWGAPIIRGFNHYKTKQSRYEDVFKAYEIMRVNPDIVIVGASQVERGFSIENVSVTEGQSYNFGINDSRLWDLREYLRFIYKTCKPRIIYLAISPRFFSKPHYWNEQELLLKRSTFSTGRLQNLAGNPLQYGYQILKDTVGIPYDAWIQTIVDSRKHISDRNIFRFGWNSKQSSTYGITSKKYYYSQLYNFCRGDEIIDYSPEAMECFANIVQEAKENKVVLHIFFGPYTVDLNAILRLSGEEAKLQYIKRMVSSITPVYDFDIVSDLTTNRNDYFFDGAHFRPSLGEIIKKCIESNHLSSYGYLLTPETADDVFAKENEAWEQWKAENQEYVNALKECIETGREPKVGDFEKYIGF